jgi:hypothetical protein
MIDTVIGISGKIASGKSELAQRLKNNSGSLSTYIEHFAGPLKRDLEVLTGHQITNANKDIFRVLMQNYGTAMRLLNGEDYWPKRLLSEFARAWKPIVDMPGTMPLLIVDDLRYENEADFLRSMEDEGCKVYLIRLQVSPEVQARRYFAKYGREMNPDYRLHTSETTLDNYLDWDILVDTDIFTEIGVYNRVTEALEKRGLHFEEPGL